MRLIDAHKLLDDIETNKDAVDIVDIVESIMVSPTVDAVPVIRCKDCKHARKCYGDIVWASKGGGYIYNPLGFDGFCSIAERKEE